MAQNFEAGLLRVLTAGGVTMGAGFLIGDRLVLTCAHVVCKAGYMPDQSIQLKFHHNDQSVQATVLPKFWRDTEKEDLAVLRLELETLP
ncbi:MAG: trypsin-like peptidase domain-containing protein, partial [Chloroflexi bacterium]|nr:trypsin-like peptidase domain-containing protein [Chloroflexota bacterium]